jgi:rhomboid protease GluP
VTLNNSQPQDNPPVTPYPQSVQVRLPTTPPYVTYGLLGITVFVFLLQLGTKYLFGGDLPAALGAKVNDLIVQGQYWRLVTPMFLHSSTMFLHIAFNMYALYAFGPSLERYYGHVRFIALYLLAGFTGNVLSFMFSNAASLGASTAIFGLVGAEAVFLYRNRKLLGSRAQGALINLLVIVVLNLFLGLSSGFVDNWGHIGGLLGGVLFAWFGGPLMEVDGSYPNLQIVDKRSTNESLLIALVIFVVFAALAGITIIQRS